jgi:hypothetical protein
MNQIVIIMVGDINPPAISYIDQNNILLPFKIYRCPRNFSVIYTLSVDYKYSIKLKIADETIETYVNRYPIFNDEIIFSTMVKNEDNYIKQWIKYHLKIGVTRFIVYDNSEIDDGLSYGSVEKTSNLKLLLKDYIEKKIVLLIKWSYPKRLKKNGISGQATQQNHSIYAFRQSKYIGLFDIDEYINIQHTTNIRAFLEDTIINEKININDIGSFRLLNKFFYNINNLPTDGDNFLKIFNCGKICQKGHEKNFVIPKNVNIYAIHRITDGKPMYTINGQKIYFNHYYFLNKAKRGVIKTNLTDDSILKISMLSDHDINGVSTNSDYIYPSTVNADTVVANEHIDISGVLPPPVVAAKFMRYVPKKNIKQTSDFSKLRIKRI